MLSVVALLWMITFFELNCDALNENLKLDRVHLVDINKFSDGSINYFYRGNSPMANDSYFAYNTLKEYMSIRANQSGLPFPSKFFFIDLVLDDSNDSPDWQIEDEFFNSNGYQYKFGYDFQWDLNQHPEKDYNPANMSQNEINNMCFYNESYLWSHDKIPTRIDMIRQFLLTQRNDKLPVVMYAHCIGGCDRTGQFIASYRLMYLMKNITKIYCLDCQECGRCPGHSATIAIEWFCDCYSIQNKINVGDCNKWYDYAKLPMNDTNLSCKEPYS